MLCNRCQTPLAEGESHCPMCGAPAASVEPAVVQEEVAPMQDIVAPTEERSMNEADMPFADPMSQEPMPVKKPKPIGWIVAAVTAVIVIAVAVVLIFAMQAGQKSELDGTWKLSLHMDKYVDLLDDTGALGNEIFSSIYGIDDMTAMFEMFDVEEPLTAYAKIAEGECTFYLNTDELTEFLDVFYDKMIVYMQDGGYYDIMALQGVSRDEVDAMLAEQGLTMDMLVLSMAMGKSQMISMLKTQLTGVGMEQDDSSNIKLFSLSYSYEDGKLAFGMPGSEIDRSQAVAVQVDGDRLLLDPGNNLTAKIYRDLLTIERAELP